MHPIFERNLLQTRRQFFASQGLNMGALALGLLGAQGTRVAAEQVHKPLAGLPHHTPKAKAIIYMHMNGAPSQIDLWDYKPRLKEFFNKDLPPSVQGGQRLSTMTSGQARFPVAPSKFKFTQEGKCGRWINSELLPFTAQVVDEIAVVKSVFTNAINHDPVTLSSRR